MAEAEQPSQPDLPGSESSPPRTYVNFAAAQGSPLELALTLGYREGDANPLAAALLVMNWEFVPVLIKLLQDQVDAYEERAGPIRDVSAESKEPG